MRWASVLAVAVIFSTLHGAADAESAPAACVYKSENYSEGAAICANKALMLTCVPSGERLVWKVTREPDQSSLCPAEATRRHRTIRVARRERPTMRAARDVLGARCFAFNGKTYCE